MALSFISVYDVLESFEEKALWTGLSPIRRRAIQSLACPVNLKGLHHRDLLLKHLSSSGDYDDFQPRHNFWDVLGSPRSKFLQVDV